MKLHEINSRNSSLSRQLALLLCRAPHACEAPPQPSGIAVLAVLGIGVQQTIAARLRGLVPAAWAAETLHRGERRGQPAPAAGQSWLASHPAPAGAAAAGAGGGDAAHQPEGQLPDAGHGGGIAMGAHVALQLQQACIGVSGGLLDRPVQGGRILNILDHPVGWAVACERPHQQPVAGEAHPSLSFPAMPATMTARSLQFSLNPGATCRCIAAGRSMRISISGGCHDLDGFAAAGSTSLD